jgi:hypothetical protein
MAAIFRDSPAGQILRIFLGRKIAPYTDEKEGFELSRSISKPQVPTPERDTDNDIEKDDELDNSEEKENVSDNDIENSNSDQAAVEQIAAGVSVVEWIGPEDEDNPQNWSSGKKIFVFIQICLLTFSSKCITLSRSLRCTYLSVNSLQRLSYHYTRRRSLSGDVGRFNAGLCVGAVHVCLGICTSSPLVDHGFKIIFSNLH